MRSPFPGMDPYLEGPLWMTFHSQLVVEIARQLAPKIRPKYVTLTTERFVLDDMDGVAVTTAGIYPDVSIAVSPPRRRIAKSAAHAASAPLLLETVVPERVPHLSVEIRDRLHRQLVTAIEVLSPTNKRGLGREEYLAKRQRLMLSSAHLLEIDLLRIVKRVPMRRRLPAAPYFVLLSRAQMRPELEVWPITLQESLPVVPVPLLPGDPDASLDLQLALKTNYDQFRYDLSVDYTKPPEVRLRPTDAAWVEKRLRKPRARRQA